MCHTYMLHKPKGIIQMKAKFMAPALLVVGSLVVGGMTQANAENIKVRGPFAFDVDTCQETVPISGKFQFNINVTEDKAGGFHFSWRVTAVGEGLGELSGVRYRWNDTVTIAAFNATAGGTFVSHAVTKTALISQGSLDNLRVFLHTQVTQTPDGEFVVDKFELKTDCAP